MTTVLAPDVRLFPAASFACTVIVEVEPPALIDVGLAEIVEVVVDAELTVIALDDPVLPLAVAVIVTDSTLLSFVEIVNVPFVSVLVLSPKVLSPLLSNSA